MSDDFDNDINNIDEVNEETNEDNEDFDEDHDIDDYAGQDTDIDNSGKKNLEKNKNDDNDDLFDLNDIDDFEKKYNTNGTIVKKKTSGYPVISQAEEAKLYGLLTTYIIENKLSVPEGMKDEEIMQSGDAYRIARFWLDNRDKYPIDMKLSKNLYGKVVEMVDPNKLKTHHECGFHDDNNDEYRFAWNFRNEPYDVSH